MQALDLTTVLRDDEMQLHLTGTNFFEPIENETLTATRDAYERLMTILADQMVSEIIATVELPS